MYVPNRLRPKTLSQLRAKKFSNQLRKQPPPSELAVKRLLSDNGIPFIFQHSIVALRKLYILDFYIPQLKLAIEVDGSTHDNTKEYDWTRDRAMKEQHNIVTWRISNKSAIEISSADFANNFWEAASDATTDYIVSVWKKRWRQS